LNKLFKCSVELFKTDVKIKQEEEEKEKINSLKKRELKVKRKKKDNEESTKLQTVDMALIQQIFPDNIERFYSHKS
jgi:hypothetical protein